MPADPDSVISALTAVGVDFSIDRASLVDFLGNEFTSYPAIAAALLRLLTPPGLRRPVFIDVIDFNYEASPGNPSPRRVEDVDFAILEKAVLDGFNNRYGEQNGDFQQLLGGGQGGEDGQTGSAGVTRDLTKETFGDAVRSNDIVLVHFSATWAGPSHAFAPIFAASSESHADVLHGRVDVDAEDQLASAAQVATVPTVMAFKKRRLIFNHAGGLSASQLEDLVQQAKSFDVDAAVAAAAGP